MHVTCNMLGHTIVTHQITEDGNIEYIMSGTINETGNINNFKRHV